MTTKDKIFLEKFYLSRTSNGVQEKVFLCVAKIPRGKVMTYQGVARAIGHPRAARAVGNALGKNPFTFHNSKNDPRRIPCHRVIRSDGRVGGYNGPSGTKERLLKKEGVNVINHRLNCSIYHVRS